MLSRTEKNKTKAQKIKLQEQKEKTKKIIRKLLKFLFISFIIIFFIFSYIYYVSTSCLTVREYSNLYKNLPIEFHGFKIIQFGDIYYNNNYSKIINKIVKNINELKPDLVLFTGNLFHNKYNISEKDKNQLIDLLSSINSTTGKYFVISDTDNEEVIEIFTKSNFIFLDNSSESIYFNGNTPIILNGFLNTYSNDYKNNNLFQITLTPDPQNIDKILTDTNPEIIMSGKTLNGQIIIPYYGSIIKNHYKYYKPYYNINNTEIYITGGIGTNNYPIRIFNHPSINFYRLRAK